MKKVLVLLLLCLLALSNTPLYGGPDLSFFPNRAIINPAPEPGDPEVSARVILTCSREDFDLVGSLASAADPLSYVWDCPLRHGSWGGKPVTIVGPVIGAPHAVMVTEKLIALAARMILFFGHCGSLQSKVRIGDLVLPNAAVTGEGTSVYYYSGNFPPKPDANLYNLIKNTLSGIAVPWHQGAVWSTDAIYRETVRLVHYYQHRGVKGVEMEMSAFFNVGKYRKVAVAGLLAVSDELFTYSWPPGFNTPAFQQARNLAARAVLDTAAAWEGH